MKPWKWDVFFLCCLLVGIASFFDLGLMIGRDERNDNAAAHRALEHHAQIVICTLGESYTCDEVRAGWTFTRDDLFRTMKRFDGVDRIAP